MTEKENLIIEAVETLAVATNILTDANQHKIFVATLQKQHRTLQQNVWKLIFKAIPIYAASEEHDLRNEGSVNACKSITNFIKEHLDDFYFPHV